MRTINQLSYCGVVFFIASFTFFSEARARDAEEGYTRSMFGKSMREDGLVLIRVPSAPRCMNNQICVAGGWLLKAIQMEYRLGFGERGERQALKIAVANKARKFSFKNRAASNNIGFDYSCKQVAFARNTLAKFSRLELINQLGPEDSTLHRLYLRDDPRPSTLYAVAHILLEKGIVVRIQDSPGRLEQVE